MYWYFKLLQTQHASDQKRTAVLAHATQTVTRNVGGAMLLIRKFTPNGLKSTCDHETNRDRMGLWLLLYIYSELLGVETELPY